jgi:hypothetical protein
MSKVSKDVAAADINRWLDFKKVPDRRRSDLSDQVESLVSMVEEGNLIVNEDCSLELILTEPIAERDRLRFKTRLQVRDIHTRLKGAGIKGGDADGRIVAYISALTGLSMGECELLDTSDYSFASNVVVFFM